MWKTIFLVLTVAGVVGCGAGSNSGDLCKDGWVTPSKGKQGACSSHGGLA